MVEITSFCVIWNCSCPPSKCQIKFNIDKNNLIKLRYYRHDCLNVGNCWYKDASKCGIDEKRVLIIDDSPNCHLTYKSKINV